MNLSCRETGLRTARLGEMMGDAYPHPPPAIRTPAKKLG
jgi:hypothetical protein